MASRWRIRHKLMLGLGLVVATMALLLGGTLFGLWSYYLDMNSLRSKTTQLQLAEKIKSAVSDLTQLVVADNAPRANEPAEEKPPRPPSEPPEFPKMPPFPVDGNEATQREPKPTTPRQAIQKANKTLDKYEASLKESGDYDPQAVSNVHAAYIRELRKALQMMMASLKEKEKQSKQIEEKNGLDAAIFPQEGDVMVDIVERREQAERMQVIERNAADLCDFIYEEIRDRINGSRRNYQNTFWIVGP
ncbi:MAG TPA: hypothetical protein VH682_00260, partial [Gemmataceae bacterium]